MLSLTMNKQPGIRERMAKLGISARDLKRPVFLPRTKGRGSRRAYSNDNTALIPQVWSNYSVAILKSKMVASELFFRDFQDEIQDFGDTVNTRKPSKFTVFEKSDADPITIQDASSTNIAVKLDQHPHVSFKIKDGEQSLAMEDLIQYYLEPAMIALAERTDAKCLGMLYGFLGSNTVGGTQSGGQAGSIGGLTNANYAAALTELGLRMDTNRCPDDIRHLIVTPNMKRLILQNTLMVKANERGDMGTALRTANIGEIYGFEHWMCQNAPSFAGTFDTTTGFVINHAGGYSIGDTVLTVGTGTGALVTGNWCTILGKLYQITAHTETLGNTTSITVTPPLYEAVANTTAVTVYDSGQVNLVAGYAAGWNKPILFKTWTNPPKVGQLISFKTDPETYSVVAVDTGASSISLNRPLVRAYANNDIINYGPPGDFGFAFHPHAVSLVMRALNLPKQGAGALGGRAAFGGLSLRIVMQYDATNQGHIVTCDLLMGLQMLDPNLGSVLLG